MKLCTCFKGLAVPRRHAHDLARFSLGLAVSQSWGCCFVRKGMRLRFLLRQRLCRSARGGTGPAPESGWIEPFVECPSKRRTMAGGRPFGDRRLPLCALPLCGAQLKDPKANSSVHYFNSTPLAKTKQQKPLFAAQGVRVSAWCFAPFGCNTSLTLAVCISTGAEPKACEKPSSPGLNPIGNKLMRGPAYCLAKALNAGKNYQVRRDCRCPQRFGVRVVLAPRRLVVAKEDLASPFASCEEESVANVNSSRTRCLGVLVLLRSLCLLLTGGLPPLGLRLDRLLCWGLSVRESSPLSIAAERVVPLSTVSRRWSMLAAALFSSAVGKMLRSTSARTLCCTSARCSLFLDIIGGGLPSRMRPCPCAVQLEGILFRHPVPDVLGVGGRSCRLPGGAHGSGVFPLPLDNSIRCRAIASSR